jgi:hypothetical protein
MSQTVEITIAAAGTDTGPFNIFSNLDYVTPINTGVLKSELLAGYTSSVVPDTATSVRVKSTGNCTNYVDMTITSPTPSTVSITVNQPQVFFYPVTAGNGSASGTITNSTGATVYIYGVCNSGPYSSGSVGANSGVVDTTSLLFTGSYTASNQTIYSYTYYALPDGATHNWSLSKQDTLSSGATLKLGYASTIGGSVTNINS